jgi:hypothetical protein
MKMVKRTLIAMTVIALLATVSWADWVEDPFTDYNLGWPNGGNYTAVKVEGKDTYEKDFLWPYEISISYKPLIICNIPVTMEVGMYVQIDKCKDLKLALAQDDCGELGIAADKYPCYWGCVDFKVRSNFDVMLGAEFHQDGDILAEANTEVYYDSGNPVTGDGDYHDVKLCMKAWSAAIYKATPGETIGVGNIDITVKPN